MVDNGVVAWPYGTLCLHHLVVAAHLRCRPQIFLHVTMQAVVDKLVDNGVVAWPYGTVCMQHLVAAAHLQRTALTSTNFSTCSD